MTPAENLKDKMNMIEQIQKLQILLNDQRANAEKWQERYHNEKLERVYAQSQLRANGITPYIWG